MWLDENDINESSGVKYLAESKFRQRFSHFRTAQQVMSADKISHNVSDASAGCLLSAISSARDLGAGPISHCYV